MIKSSNHRLGDRIVWLFGRVTQQTQRLIRQQMDSAGLRTQHYHVLASLADSGEAAQAQLADRIGLDRSDLVTVLDELQILEYVVRRTDPADRRRNIVGITERGQEVLGRMDQLIITAEDQLLAPLTAAERKTLTGLLARLVPPSE